MERRTVENANGKRLIYYEFDEAAPGRDASTCETSQDSSGGDETANGRSADATGDE